jgi:hypothetical protein
MPIDVKRLRKECAYESQAPLALLVNDLDEISRVAEGWKSKRKQLITTGVILLVLTIPFFVVFFPLGLVSLGAGIFLLWHAKSYPKWVAQNADRCTFVRSVISMLGSDADFQTPAKLRLGFGTAQNLVGESALHNRRNGKQRFYKTPVVELEARLLDGTTFSESVDELVRQRSFTNPRGKSKTKTRTRFQLSMRFAYDSDVYGDASRSGAQLQKEVLLPPTSAYHGGVITNKAIKVKALVGEKKELERSNTMLALGVYRVLNLSRKLHARARAQARKGGGQ